MSNNCLLSGSLSAEGAHVISKGPQNLDFQSVYKTIYIDSEYISGIEDVQNIIFLREDFHRGPMDNLNLPFNLRIRRIGFDFINNVSYIESFESGEIEKIEWQYFPDVKREYFAWSNYHCTKRLKKYMRKINRLLINYSHWTDN
ncbi:MAG: HNH endonuclease signature motif containing protein [Candidatus Thalassarchaeaceae archaeon]